MSRFYLILLGTLFLSCFEGEKGKDKAKPNIVFIFTDDQTYSSIRALGNNEIITPAMDRLVSEGTTFTHAYNMGSWSGAVCVASRAMLISGRSVWRANELSENWKNNDSIEKSWGRLMERAGYDTYMTGKWHVAAPVSKVFQNTKNIRPGMPGDAWNHSKMLAKFDSLTKSKSSNYEALMPNGYNRPLSENDSTWLPYDKSKGGFWKGGKHWSEVLRDDAINFIETAKIKDTPFFMYLAFSAPHDPRQAPKEYQDMYNLDDISVPESFLSDYPFKRAIDNGKPLRDESLAPFPRTEYAVKVHTKEYYASITHLDEQISHIVKALKESGKMDNTYIFLTSDHGLAMGRHGLLGKQNLYDHSVRAPLVVLGPDIPKNKKVNADVYIQDVMATALELSGKEKPKYVEFNSLLDLAQGKTKISKYDAIYGAYLNLSRMIRKDGYKLIVYPNMNKIMLFDLNKDPEEINDISSNPANNIKVRELFMDLLEMQRKMDDPLNLDHMGNML